jgi:3',5'-cyclic AMP phosphodiesterase CpdA
VIIAHLSDLHVGLKHADDRLEELYKAIKIVEPDLIVLTGDIADSPTGENCDQVKKAVRRLEDMCANGVCLIYGNHDKFPKGNRMTRWLHSSAKIADGLASYAATPQREVRIKGIRLGLLGIDSASDARYLAQGYIEPDQLDRVERDAAKFANTCDILIAYLHHHPLKIAEVEESALLAASTSLVNSA